MTSGRELWRPRTSFHFFSTKKRTNVPAATSHPLPHRPIRGFLSTPPLTVRVGALVLMERQRKTQKRLEKKRRKMAKKRGRSSTRRARANQKRGDTRRHQWRALERGLGSAHLAMVALPGGRREKRSPKKPRAGHRGRFSRRPSSARNGRACESSSSTKSSWLAQSTLVDVLLRSLDSPRLDRRQSQVGSSSSPLHGATGRIVWLCVPQTGGWRVSVCWPIFRSVLRAKRVIKN